MPQAEKLSETPLQFQGKSLLRLPWPRDEEQELAYQDR